MWDIKDGNKIERLYGRSRKTWEWLNQKELEKNTQKERGECVCNEMDEDTTQKADGKTILDWRPWGEVEHPKRNIRIRFKNSRKESRKKEGCGNSPVRNSATEYIQHTCAGFAPHLRREFHAI